MTFWEEIWPEISKIEILTKNPDFSNVHIYSFHASKIQNLENPKKHENSKNQKFNFYGPPGQLNGHSHMLKNWLFPVEL